MYCPHCGKKISLHSQYCPHCGNKIHLNNSSRSTKSDRDNTAFKLLNKDTKRNDNKRLRTLSLSLIVAAALIITVVGIVASNPPAEFFESTTREDVPIEETTISNGLSYSQPMLEHVRIDSDTGTAYVDNEIVVFGSKNTDENDIVAAVKNSTGKEPNIVGKAETINCYQLRFDNAMDLDDINDCMSSMREEGVIDEAFPQYVLNLETTEKTNDPAWSDSPEEGKPGKTWGLEAIRVPEAWELVEANSNTRIGIIDSQFYIDHEDIDDVFIDGIAISGRQFAAIQERENEETGVAEEYLDTHGTHVAGIIGAESNDKGSVGIAHGASLYGYSCIGTDEEGNPKITTNYDLTVGLVYLVAINNCTVVNMSVEVTDDVLRAASGDKSAEARLDVIADCFSRTITGLIDVEFDKFIIVKSAGNEGQSGARAEMGMLGRITDERVASRILIVGALQANQNGKPITANYTSGGTRVDVWAPGSDIYSTIYDIDIFGKAISAYGYLSGTSMAAPMVAGVVGLVQTANPQLTGDQVKDVITSTKMVGTDMVDAEAAVNRAQHYVPSDSATLLLPKYMWVQFNGDFFDYANLIYGQSEGDSYLAEGIIGQAVHLDGDGDYISFGHNNNIQGNFTCNLWVKPEMGNETRSDAALLAKYETNHYGSYDFYLSYNRPAYWVSDGKGGEDVIISDEALANDVWSMVTYVYDASKERMRIFINGVLVTEENAVNVTNTHDEVTLGRQALMFEPKSDLEYQGWLDDLRIFDTILDEEEISYLYSLR